MNCSECKKNIDDEEPIVIGDIRLPTCIECYEVNWNERRSEF